MRREEKRLVDGMTGYSRWSFFSWSYSLISLSLPLSLSPTLPGSSSPPPVCSRAVAGDGRGGEGRGRGWTRMRISHHLSAIYVTSLPEGVASVVSPLDTPPGSGHPRASWILFPPLLFPARPLTALWCLFTVRLSLGTHRQRGQDDDRMHVPSPPSSQPAANVVSSAPPVLTGSIPRPEECSHVRESKRVGEKMRRRVG